MSVFTDKKTGCLYVDSALFAAISCTLVFTDKKTGCLYVQFDYKGKTYKKRMSPEMKKKEARDYETAWKARLFKPESHSDEKPEIVFEQFLVKYYLPYSEANKASFARDVVICQVALGFFKGMNLRAVKPAHIEEFKKARLKTKTQHDTPRKPATVQRELSVVSKIFSLALEHNFVDSNPCSRVKKLRFDNTCTRKLSESDEPKFFAAFESEWAHDVCLFILNTGLRQGDALGLQPRHVDWQNEQIRLLQGKTQRVVTIPTRHVDWQNEQIRLLQGKTQRVVTIPMNGTVQTLVKKWLAKKGEYVFFSPKSGTRGVSVKKAIEGACRRAKISPLTVRDLRRTAATRLLERGANHLSIAKFLGHSDLRVLQRYAQPDQALKDAAKLLEKPNPTKILPETGGNLDRIAVSR